MFNPLKKHWIWLVVPVLTVACGDDPDSSLLPPPFEELVPEQVVYTNANLIYYGDDTYSGASDWWTLTLYTDMEIDQTGSPVGPGRMICLDLNTGYNKNYEPDLALLTGTYRSPTNTGDISPGTFNPGFMNSIDLPGGQVERPGGTFFGDIPAGTTQFDADLLSDGYCRIDRRDDGTFRVEGMLVGTEYLKRYFSFEGELTAIDRSEGGESEVPNSTLTQDIDLTSLTRTKIVDKGDSYMLGDESYRLFLLFLAEESVDLSGSWPTGEGRLLRIELFVPWTADPAEGIPVGTYTVAPQVEGTGAIYKDDIVPFRVVPGYPDKFTNNSGTWYQRLTGGEWSEWARVTGGSIEVERPDGAHRLTIDLTDCGTPARHIRCVWESDDPIETY